MSDTKEPSEVERACAFVAAAIVPCEDHVLEYVSGCVACDYNRARRTVITAARAYEAEKADCHALKRAISPTAAGAEPWDGMPSTEWFVSVAERLRASATRVVAWKHGGGDGE